jgi:hypothetical protein
MVFVPVNAGGGPSANDKLHVPAAMNDTTIPETVHTLVVLDVTVSLPVPKLNVGVKVEPTAATLEPAMYVGLFEMPKTAAEAGAATDVNPTTLMANATSKATHRGRNPRRPARCDESELANVNIVSPHDRLAARSS